MEQFDEKSQPEGVPTKIREPKNKDIFARYTEQYRWRFEEKMKSHSQPWKELANIFSHPKKKLPECFKKLFLDLSSYGPYEYKGKLNKEQIEFCLKELAGLRHSAHYRGEFFDDFTSDLIDSREVGIGDGITIPTDIISTLLIEFAQDFFKMLGIFICDQSTVLNRIPESFGKGFLRWIIFTPKIELRHAVKEMPNRKGISERTEVINRIYDFYIEPLLNKYNKVKDN
ncbi:hypothetical protein ES703_28316 [subsurface metagenome]